MHVKSHSAKERPSGTTAWIAGLLLLRTFSESFGRGALSVWAAKGNAHSSVLASTVHLPRKWDNQQGLLD